MRSGIKCLFGEHGIALHVQEEHHDRREGVRELHDAYCADQGAEVGDVGNAGADDECETPVDGHHGYPDHFAAWRVQARESEELAADILVYDFDADVAVERGGDQGGDQGKGVAGGLPVVVGDSGVGA